MPAGSYSADSQVKNVFTFMKSANTLAGSQLLSFELKKSDSEVIGYLMPIGNFFLEDKDLISNLTLWRKLDADSYPTRFEVDEPGTFFSKVALRYPYWGCVGWT